MRAVLIFLVLMLGGVAHAAGPPEADRKAILGMAGDYRVRFDFRETVSFDASYKPIPENVQGGFESVRVAVDRPGFISLQHILVGGDPKSPIVTKHWRQDWTWEPRDVVAYVGRDRWATKPVSAAERAGAWSQTVWQVDDSPRYGGVGRWRHDGGASRWTSDDTLRPLARRDATRHPPYDELTGVNRHALTPAGWVHEQDNSKLALHDGVARVVVHETGLNTYTRDTGYPVKAADDYWRATSAYWAAVRNVWAEALRRPGGVTVREEAQNGSMTSPPLLDLAEEVMEGKRTLPAAVAEARRVIGAETAGAQRVAAAAR